MKNGPVTSEALDLVNAGRLGNQRSRWNETMSDRNNHRIELLNDPGTDHLSESEIELIDSIYSMFGSKDQWELRDWCHSHSSEWKPLADDRNDITVEQMAALHTGRQGPGVDFGQAEIHN